MYLDVSVGLGIYMITDYGKKIKWGRGFPFYSFCTLRTADRKLSFDKLYNIWYTVFKENLPERIPSMLSPKGLIQLYSTLQEQPQPHIRLPVRFFILGLGEFFLLLLTASVTAINVLSLVSAFLWVYVPLLAVLYSKIWDLYGLSVPKLYGTLGVFFLVTLPLGPPIRTLLYELFCLL